MYVLRVVSGFALAAVLASPVVAQSVAALGGPAELPPANFSSEQYVDSRGCVFIRVGYGDEENWVPRVSRDRQPLCGYQPSLSGAAPVAVAAAPEPAPAPEPSVTITAAPPAEPPRPVAIAATTTPARPAPAATSPAPTTTLALRPTPTRPAAAQPVRVASCQGLPSSASQYMHGQNVRCGPQPVHPSSGLLATAAALEAGEDIGPVSVPEGYRVAWDDGRLNPERGLAHATPAGDASMAQVWSNTVPRVAIAPDPAADGVPVSYSPSGVVVTRASSNPDIALEEVAATTPEPITVRIPAGHRYVEVARYSDRDSADGARLNLMQRGLPTRLGGIQHGGEVTAFVVLAGPFEDRQQLGRTLVTVQRYGYSGAVTR